jgi:hypothetical protein
MERNPTFVAWAALAAATRNIGRLEFADPGTNPCISTSTVLEVYCVLVGSPERSGVKNS